MKLFCILSLIGCAMAGCQTHPGAPIGPGTVLTAHDEQGAPVTLRIDKIEKDAKDADGDVFLYETSVRSTDGTWRPFCLPDREGKNRAIPLQGSWDVARNHVPSAKVITFACTNGALGKCVRMGYKPWKTVNGVSLADYHQACVHMVPADYCGNGQGHTRNGTQIDVYDRLGIQKRDTTSGMVFEAAWSPRGAAYLNKPRYAGEALDELVGQCPENLGRRTALDGPALDAQGALDRWPDALIVTESRVVSERP